MLRIVSLMRRSVLGSRSHHHEKEQRTVMLNVLLTEYLSMGILSCMCCRLSCGGPLMCHHHAEDAWTCALLRSGLCEDVRRQDCRVVIHMGFLLVLTLLECRWTWCSMVTLVSSCTQAHVLASMLVRSCSASCRISNDDRGSKPYATSNSDLSVVECLTWL